MALPTDWEMGPEWEGYNSVDEGTHEALALWAADCAEHVLHYFEEKHPDDDRPRNAIEAARAWTRGEVSVGEAIEISRDTHAAAREADGTPAAKRPVPPDTPWRPRTWTVTPREPPSTESRSSSTPTRMIPPLAMPNVSGSSNTFRNGFTRSSRSPKTDFIRNGSSLRVPATTNVQLRYPFGIAP